MHTMKMNPLFFLLSLLCSILATGFAQPFDYPTANISTQWINSPSLKHTVNFPSGATVRALLLRGNFGPSLACGFFCMGACDAFLFAIFIVYTNSGSLITNPMIASPQVVWVANRDRPVKENATLQFSADGNLVLRDSDGSVVWSTKTSGKSVVGMRITDVGSLELFDKSNSLVWSSVDHPTDSWVLGQTLRQGQQLTANVSGTDSTRGPAYLSIVNGGFAAYVGASPPQLYYKNIVDTTKISSKMSTHITFTNGSLAIFTRSKDPRRPDATVNLPQASSMQYMRLDYGGHLRLYEWSPSGWQPLGNVFNLFPDDCAYPTVCGKYGICSDGGQCSCPVGDDGNSNYFRPIVARHPSLGCSPITPLSCKSNASHQLLAMRNVSYFNYVDSNAAAMHGTNEETCKQACMKNCSCKAAFFLYSGNSLNGDCFLPSQIFSMSDNNPAISHLNWSAFIKVQNPQSSN